MKTILVTGGAGFVGSHACKALSRAGHLPVTFDNLERGHDWAVKWGPLEKGDLRNDNDRRCKSAGSARIGLEVGTGRPGCLSMARSRPHPRPKVATPGGPPM
jgi:nucleoside-diphosphate-sugar epimerase